jgi:hypothetical protein
MEDWEDDDFVLPIINSKEQLKRLEERKLMEDSNNELIEDLFSTEDVKLQDVKLQDVKLQDVKLPHLNFEPPKPPKPSQILLPPKPPPRKKKFNSNIQTNEMKQKEASKKIKEAKEKKKRASEIYGDNDYEYDDYEDKFYNY